MEGIGFFVSISLAYAAVCVAWLFCRRWLTAWPTEDVPTTERPWLDLLLIPVVAVGVFALGECFRRGWLLPEPAGAGRYLTVAVNLCIPYAPLALVLLLRRQSPQTVMLSARALGYKVGVGTLAALVGLMVYLISMGQAGRFGTVMQAAGTPHALAHAPNVFLEGVAIAFVYERLRWAMGGWASIWVPCLLFAAAHVPRSIESGRPPEEILIWFGFNTLLPAMILLVLRRSRDVIWIFIPHYLLDVAIGAFG